MPIRQPNGIWIPTFSPASRIDVAPSISMVLSEIANVTVPPSPPLSVRAMANRSMCRSSDSPAASHIVFDRVQHGRGSACPCRPVSPVRHEFVEVLEVELAVLLGELQVQPVAGLAGLQVPQFVVEDDVLRGRRGVQVHDVGALSARGQRAQHRHQRGDAAAGADEQNLRRWRVGQREVSLGGREPNDRSRCDAVDQVRGQKAFGRCLDGDRDAFLIPHRHGGQRVRPPVPPAFDAQADADVLAGL